jgi:hypothetical protein
MSFINIKSVIIEGDKSNFCSKGAIDRFKRDLKLNDQEKLEKNDYFIKDCSYKIISSNDTEIKVLLEKKEPVKVEINKERELLLEKLRLKKQNNMPASQIKAYMKNKVPEEILEAYLELKKFKVNVPILSPNDVLNQPDKFKQTIHQMIQSFGIIKVKKNPVFNYYKLLAQHLGIPTEYIVPQQQQQQQQQQPQQPLSFIDEVKKQKMNSDMIASNEIDDEMKKIYESLGIDCNKNTNTEEPETIDDEMKKIYESLGMSV